MTKNDKTYGVRISVDLGNAITLELKGAGRAHIVPNKDYYFENAPIEFINYITQLRKLGLTYRITPDKKGCFQTYDLKNYKAVPNLLFRNGTFIPVNPIEEKKETHVVAKPEDTIKVDIPVVLENIPNKPEVKDETPVEETKPTEEVKDETPVENENTKVYTEDELMYYSKKELLTVATEKNLPMSEINTKKEIRQAILDSQN